MFDIKTLTAQAVAALRKSYSRLSITQQLMMRGVGLVAGLVLLSGLVGGWAPTGPISDGSDLYMGTAVLSDLSRRSPQTDSALGDLDMRTLRLSRDEALLGYSSHYGVGIDMAQMVYDVALREGIHPDLGFRLVEVESGFNVRARSRANAYGLTQVQLPTARFYESDITVDRLYEPERNLRIGFRYLRYLIDRYGDINIALLAYNRGPTRVKTLIDAGRNPDNGYPRALMEGFTGGM